MTDRDPGAPTETCDHLWALRGSRSTLVSEPGYSAIDGRFVEMWGAKPTHDVFFCSRCLAERAEPKPEWRDRFPVGPVTRKVDRLTAEPGRD